MPLMATSKTAQIVADLVRPEVEKLGLRLWDVRYLKEGASWYLRVYIDSDNGISIDDCTNVSHAIDPIIDEADPIRESYFLEVCSPGICRELVTDEHFVQMAEKRVLVHTVRNENGKRDIFGTLLKRTDDSVVLLCNEEETSISRANIAFVRLDEEKQ